MLKGDTDTDTDTLISEISIPIPIPILFKYRISILIRYRYDTFGQKYRNFDIDTIVSKVSGKRKEFFKVLWEIYININYTGFALIT